MKRIITMCAMLFLLGMALVPSAFAADTEGAESTENSEAVYEVAANAAEECYPTSVTQSDDMLEIRKAYDLSPEQDPAGISRADFERDGYRYAFADLLKQELPEHEERQHVENVTIPSQKKDMATVLSLLPQEREFVTEDGLAGMLTLRLDTVEVNASGYGSTTKEITATRSYPNLVEQDTEHIPKTIEDNGRTLTLQHIEWQTDNTANVDGYAIGDRFTAVATYTGSATSSYVKGYNITAQYAGTVSRIILKRVRYVAVFRGTPIEPPAVEKPAAAESVMGAEPLAQGDASDSQVVEPPVIEPPVIENPLPKISAAGFQFRWTYLLAPLSLVAAVGTGLGIALVIKRRKENDVAADDDEEDETE